MVFRHHVNACFLNIQQVPLCIVQQGLTLWTSQHVIALPGDSEPLFQSLACVPQFCIVPESTPSTLQDVSNPWQQISCLRSLEFHRTSRVLPCTANLATLPRELKSHFHALRYPLQKRSSAETRTCELPFRIATPYQTKLKKAQIDRDYRRKIRNL